MTRTKIFLYSLLLLAIMVLPACQQEQRTVPVDQDGERVSVSFSVDVPNYAPMRAVDQKGIDENEIRTLELLVFNKEGLMADYALATNLTEADGGKYTFSAQLKPQTEPCVIHFVANHNYGGSDAARQYLGRKESDVLLSELVTMEQVVAAKTIPMWARRKYDEVKENSDLGEIEVLRSMAKFTVYNEATDLSEVSYTLCNSYDCGSVAPFKRAALPDLDKVFSVDNRVPTVPKESFLANGDTGLGWYELGTHVYGFERENKVANPISCLVIRAKYKSATEPSYYKLDFVKSDNRLERYDLIRNYWYKVTIKKALAPGAASLEDALAGPAVNNLALSEELQAYPSYCDGKGRLEVEATNYIMTHGETTLTFKANYYPKGETQPNNSNLRIVGVRNATDHNAINSKDDVSLNKSTGEITATLQTSSGERRVSDIIVGVEGDEDLMRIVRVEVRDAYKYASFKVNGFSTESNDVTVSVAPSKQGSPLTFEIVIPNDFSTYKLPMRLRFFTEHFYPDAKLPDGMGKFAFGLAKDGAKPEGRPCYTTIISTLPADRTLRCTFLSNKSDCSETIKVVSVENFFDTQSVTVKAN